MSDNYRIEGARKFKFKIPVQATVEIEIYGNDLDHAISRVLQDMPHQKIVTYPRIDRMEFEDIKKNQVIEE